jgi:glycine cleavage system H lipoate-binding protein
MWLDVSAEHDCHIGLDALVARLLGRVDRLSYVTAQGEQCPSVVITVHGVNVHVVFPNPMRIASANAQVRVDPGKMVHDPYGAGWLFEGTEPGAHDIRRGLLSGPPAQRWMEQEVQRITELLNRCTQGKDATWRATAADGGIPVEGILRRLKRHEISKFFDELFKTEEVM